MGAPRWLSDWGELTESSRVQQNSENHSLLAFLMENNRDAGETESGGKVRLANGESSHTCDLGPPSGFLAVKRGNQI